MKVPTLRGADSPGTEGSEHVRSSDGGLQRTALQSFRRALLGWYHARSRTLSIRSARDPWAILVSEVMAQQTQIARVDQAWAVFMRRFPTPRALADVSSAAVLRAWSGLGYNRRAISLQRAARIIEAEHGGRVPADIEALEALPGVGPYTSRAVAAIAFGRPVAAVDTNVRRVVTRSLGRPLSAAELQRAADELVYRADVATWTHASMELGATVCRATDPLCPTCPVARWCASSGSVNAPAPIRGGRNVPFEQTTRWLRGRIVDRLREIDDDAWFELPGSLGSHGPTEIAAAVAALERDGLLEMSPDGWVRLPSTTT